MHCPVCLAEDTKVLESRVHQDGLSIRRRRKCEACQRRFTTYEKVEVQIPVVVKNDGRRESFSKEKLQRGLKKACQKRPISMEKIDSLIESLEKHLVENYEREVPANVIGEFLMREMLAIDPVAYVRFASFYWRFGDVAEFVKTLQDNSLKKQDAVSGTDKQQ